MRPLLHPRAFVASLLWTLGLLFLGSVVHATESSLACPDWPTCNGTMVPVMSGGIFWEHLHRLVAGGLLLLLLAGVWTAWREGASGRVRALAWAAFGLALVQALLGGLTVLFQLPDAISTSHLALAFLILAILAALAVACRAPGDELPPATGVTSRLRRTAFGVASLVYVQSVVGGVVRHTDSGLVCPDVPLCLGQVVPPLAEWPVALHFGHRVLAILVVLAAIDLAVRMRTRAPGTLAARLAGVAGVLALAQLGLGILSVTTRLGVLPVSLHTLVAAGLLSALVAAGTAIWPSQREDPVASQTSPAHVS